MVDEHANAFVHRAISEIPWLFWVFLVLFFIWGLLLISKQIYSLFHQRRRNLITELKDHLNFKDEVIRDIYDQKFQVESQKLQLEAQNSELQMEVLRREEMVNTTIESAATIVSQKEIEFNELKEKTDKKIFELKCAIGTTSWMLERETFVRQVFFMALIESKLPQDIEQFLLKHLNKMVQLLKSNQDIISETENVDTTDFFGSSATKLSPHYLRLPISDEIVLIKNIREEFRDLPSFAEKGTSNQNKNGSSS